MRAMGCAKSPTNGKRLGWFPSLGGQKAIPPGSLCYCFVTTVQYKKCCFTTTITEVCYEYVSPVRPNPALGY